MATLHSPLSTPHSHLLLCESPLSICSCCWPRLVGVCVCWTAKWVRSHSWMPMLTITITHSHTHTCSSMHTPRVRSRRNWQFQINAPKPVAEAGAAAASSLNGLRWPGLARSGPVLARSWPALVDLRSCQKWVCNWNSLLAKLQQPKAAPTAVSDCGAGGNCRSSCTRRCEQLESFNATKLKSFSNES